MCPRCHSAEVSASRSFRVRDLFMKLWGMKAFRCRECNKRFYLPEFFSGSIESRRLWLRGRRKRKRRSSSGA